MSSKKAISEAQESRRPFVVLARPEPRGWMRRLRLEPEDLVAIPLCLLWCLSYVLISAAVGNGLERHLGASADVSVADPASLWRAVVIVASVTMTAVRQLFHL